MCVVSRVWAMCYIPHGSWNIFTDRRVHSHVLKKQWQSNRKTKGKRKKRIEKKISFESQKRAIHCALCAMRVLCVRCIALFDQKLFLRLSVRLCASVVNYQFNHWTNGSFLKILFNTPTHSHTHTHSSLTVTLIRLQAGVWWKRRSMITARFR